MKNLRNAVLRTGIFLRFYVPWPQQEVATATILFGMELLEPGRLAGVIAEKTLKRVRDKFDMGL